MGCPRRWSAAVVGVVLMVTTASPGVAQYFGRNKVQYKDFQFEVLKTAHFDVYFYPEEREASRQAAEMAERWYARLTRIFEHQLTGRQPLILYASHPDFEQTNAVPGELGEGTGGVTEPFKRRIVLPLGGPLAESDHVIGHELVHAFQYDMASGGQRPGMGGGMSGLERLPLWFIEGMAEYLSLGPVDPNTAMWMRDAAGRDRMPAIRDLNDPKYFPYRWGQSLWAFVTGRWGDHVVASVLRSASVTGDAEGALVRATGLKSDELSAEWHAALREVATAVRQRTRPVSDFGRILQKGESEIAGLNVSPAISPDGRRMMFLSQRSMLSIDLYLADAHTGKVIRKITNTAVDPHFSSLEFIYSAGAWAPDSRRFVFSVVRGGQPGLVMLDVDRDTKKEVRFPELGEVFNPTWSPDGRSIAFSALQGGLTDLFVYDVPAGTTRRLTTDAFADLQPAWSPDGRSIAFVTDRFSTRLTTLDIGDYQLALMDVASGAINAVPGGAAGKNINPQWTADGELFFISDRNGISNIYRTSTEGLSATQVTNIPTGISGITGVSPAISYAPAAKRLVFSVYEDDGYNVYAADSAPVLAGRPAVTLEGIEAAKLPPQKRVSEQVVTLQGNPTIGLPAASNPKVEPYKPKLSLDFAGQPTIGIGVNSFGTYAGGGMSLWWSDMLGNHNLGAAVQINTGFGGLADTFRNSGAMVSYANTTHRWNWGVVGGQMPYVTGSFGEGLVQTPNGVVGVQQTILYRQTERSVSGMAAYPFSAAKRLEFSGGTSHIGFDQEVQTITFDPVTGNVLDEQTERQSLGEPLRLGLASAALVSDTTSFGPTSPILGERFRLQISPTFGTIRFSTVVADYRRYFMPAPFYTLAVRLLHYGRYGSGAEDARIMPLYLGYPELVRGYDFNSYGPGDCTPNLTSSCPQFDRLIGSRMMVGNVEFRFPLLRPFKGANQRMYGPLPVEVGVFADAGVAWARSDKPEWFGGTRQGVRSVGFLARVNVLGFAVAEFDVARPFDRPNRGWVWQWSFTPGF